MRPDTSGPDRRTTSVGLVLAIGALVVVTGMIVVGLIGVVTNGQADIDRPHRQSVVAGEPAAPTGPAVADRPASSSPAAPPLRDIDYYNLRTGATEPLPRPLRALPQARRFLVSPDGRMFAFEAADAYQTQIFVAGVDGDHIRQLTDGSGGASLGGWSPDSERIVLVTEALPSPLGRVAILDVRSGRLRPLTDAGYVFAASFSPDGRWVLYSVARESRPDTWRTDLWRVPAGGGRPTLLIAHGDLGAYAPDGATIAYHRSSATSQPFCGTCLWHDDRLTFVPSDGREQPATANSGMLAPLNRFDGMLPRWSPDGSRILVSYPGAGFPGRIAIQHTDGHGERQIAVAFDATWFDDRTVIVVDGRGLET
jgi:Tol biopolymer transport system component